MGGLRARARLPIEFRVAADDHDSIGRTPSKGNLGRVFVDGSDVSAHSAGLGLLRVGRRRGERQRYSEYNSHPRRF